MKPHSIFPLLLSCLCLTACGDPVQKFRVTITDESGKPMPNVECRAWFNRAAHNSTAPLNSYKVVQQTDSKGIAELEGETQWYQTSVSAETEGYYSSNISKLWITGKQGNHWKPWPVKVNLVLKKIHNPHPMYAIKFDNQKWKSLPEGKLGPFGFDLEVADWVRPYGSGKIADVILEAQRKNPSDTGIMPAGFVKISFINHGDGIQHFIDEGGSSLVGPFMAPLSGYSQVWKFDNLAEVGTNDQKRDVFVFRIRTRMDSKGKVIAAQYGKLDGRIIGWLPQRIPGVLMTYYLNKCSNERNLEWDMKSNCFIGLPVKNWPSRP